MRVSILKLKEILLTSIQEDLTDQEAMDFQSDMLQKVTHFEAEGVVIDISGMDTVDSFMARIINETANMIRLLGAEVVLCGMQPSVALALTEMGRELIGVEAALNLHEGLEKVRFFIKRRNSMTEKIIQIISQKDVVFARQVGREMAKNLGFGVADQTRLATAISELARNALQYAGKGICIISGIENENDRIIKVVIEDEGPGIQNVELAMQDGYSTSKGLGAGLPGTKRLMHSFNIESEPGKTRITISIHRKIS